MLRLNDCEVPSPNINPASVAQETFQMRRQTDSKRLRAMTCWEIVSSRYEESYTHNISMIQLLAQDLNNDHTSHCAYVVGGNFTKLHT